MSEPGQERIESDYTGEALQVLMPLGHGTPTRSHSGGKLLMRSLFLLIALAAGVACGLFDLRTGAELTTAICIAVAVLALSLVKPSFAWMSATAVGLGVPIVYLWATVTGVDIPYPPSPNIAATLLALLPAVAAALLALALRRIVLGAPTAGVHH